jgi:uncharacterized membrane protein YkvI
VLPLRKATSNTFITRFKREEEMNATIIPLSLLVVTLIVQWFNFHQKDEKYDKKNEG